MDTQDNKITGLSPELDSKIQELHSFLSEVLERFDDVVYANSLGAEAMVLTDILCRYFPSVEIFTLDTGRLHEETYRLLEEVQQRYGRPIRVYYPAAEAVESYVNSHGINGFYRDPDLRQSCCHIRKVQPFARAMAGREAWITGVRRGQSAARAIAKPVEWDDDNGLYKISPLLQWEHDDIWAYISALELPYNPLHDQGFPSIGCAPCSRAIQAGEGSRDGRWWWESSTHKECGLQPRIRVA